MEATYEERLLAAFIESALPLDEEDETWVEEEIQKFPPEERDKILRIRASLKENPLTEEELSFFKH
jgi:hypothetical protein